MEFHFSQLWFALAIYAFGMFTLLMDFESWLEHRCQPAKKPQQIMGLSEKSEAQGASIAYNMGYYFGGV